MVCYQTIIHYNVYKAGFEMEILVRRYFSILFSTKYENNYKLCNNCFEKCTNLRHYGYTITKLNELWICIMLIFTNLIFCVEVQNKWYVDWLTYTDNFYHHTNLDVPSAWHFYRSVFSVVDSLILMTPISSHPLTKLVETNTWQILTEESYLL